MRPPNGTGEGGIEVLLRKQNKETGGSARKRLDFSESNGSASLSHVTAKEWTQPHGRWDQSGY